MKEIELCTYLRRMLWPMESGGLSSVSQGEVSLMGALRKNGNLLLKSQAL